MAPIDSATMYSLEANISIIGKAYNSRSYFSNDQARSLCQPVLETHFTLFSTKYFTKLKLFKINNVTESYCCRKSRDFVSK